jgi:hypothetical protein
MYPNLGAWLKPALAIANRRATIIGLKIFLMFLVINNL